MSQKKSPIEQTIERLKCAISITSDAELNRRIGELPDADVRVRYILADTFGVDPDIADDRVRTAAQCLAIFVHEAELSGLIAKCLAYTRG